MAYAPKLLTFPADRPRLSRGLAFLLGSATTLAFAPFSLSLLAPLLVLPLLFICLTLAPREAGWHGFWYGFGLFLSGTYWIYISVVVFGEAPTWIALLLIIGLSLIMAFWLFFAAWLCSRLAAGVALRLLIVAPAAWVLVEWLRGWVASGFPWLAFGYAQVDNAFGAWAPLGGIYAVSFMVMLSAVAVVTAIMTEGRPRVASLGLVFAPWLLGVLLAHADWTEADGEPLQVTILQAGISQDQKWLPQMREPTIDFYRQQTLKAAASDIIVWPEVAIPSLLSRERALVTALQSDLRIRGQSLLFGILEDHRKGADRVVFNSVILLDGSREQAYRKRHLVPFGEYFPVPEKVREWMRMMSLPHSDLSAGADRQDLLVTRAGVSLAVMICYEDAYNGEQLYALPAAGVLVNVSNDAWFGRSIAPHQHLQIARMRSLEAGRAGIRATNTGISAFIGHDGGVQAMGRQFQPEILHGSVQPRRGATPFARTGNTPVIVLCLVLLCAVWLRGRH